MGRKCEDVWKAYLERVYVADVEVWVICVARSDVKLTCQALPGLADVFTGVFQ